ncbi:MAG TPA: hypothetical protein VM925_05470 [Labilithrix sp.]|nr:hypothetical protein [Labilithrix sp.]
MISAALRIDIERWASRKEDNPVFHLARQGRLTRAMITRYIANVTYMIRLTPGHLRLARDHAVELGDSALSAHYEHKLGEEVGHDLWGEADLASLARLEHRTVYGPSVPAKAPSNTTATSSIEELAAFLTKTIADDPALYLAYLAFTEYVTVLLGPELLALIEDRCGVPKTSMTVIDKHIELDRDHAEEGFGIIDDLVGDPRKLSPLRNALAEMLAHFDRFCEEVTTLDLSDEPNQHVSAA